MAHEQQGPCVMVTSDTFCSHLNSWGTSQALRSTRVCRPLGTTRGMFSGKPPPVMCINPCANMWRHAGWNRSSGVLQLQQCSANPFMARNHGL